MQSAVILEALDRVGTPLCIEAAKEIRKLREAGWAVVNHHHTDEHLQVIINLKSALNGG